MADAANYNPLNFLDYLSYREDNKALAAEEIILRVNIGVNKAPYSDIKTITNTKDVFALVDKNHKFPADFIPDVVKIDGYYWVEEAGKAWLSMKEDALKQGIKLSLNNTYRSISDQTMNYRRKIGSGRSVASVDDYNSRPGHSEHHTGYAADMAGLGDFVNTPAHKWLSKNGYKYGFIISYQRGKEYINHYQAEGWHIRWFPLWAAEIMYKENLTLAEFNNLHLNPGAHGFTRLHK
jgi:D-alanyl-D-alanine carboxypeptidase